MKKLLLFLIACASVGTISAQLTQVVHEYYGTRGTGEDVYRIFAELDDATDFVSAIFAADNDPLFLGSDVGGVVNDGFGSITGDVLGTGFCAFSADICLDSYVTIGHAGSPVAGTTLYWDDVTVIPCGQPVNALSVLPSASAFGDSFGPAGTLPDLFLTDGSWFATNLPGCNDQGLPFGLNNRVLIAQIAVPVGGDIQYTLNMQIFNEALGADNLEYVGDAATLDAGQIDGSCLGLQYPEPAGCAPGVPGCTDSTACNYDPLADTDDGSCILPDGCTDASACNYDSTALCDDGSCILPDGCTDASACNYDSTALCDDGSCILPDGCTDASACNYDSTALCDDGSCILPDGCTDASACNYDSTALCDDGSCILPDGCTDASACNYDSTALCDDGSCCFDNCVTISVGGGSFDSEITWELQDSGGSIVASGGAPTSQDLCLADDCYVVVMNDSFGDGWNGATWSLDETGGGANYGSGTLDDGPSGTASTGVPAPCGCTDSTACNYDAAAAIDDGSCIFSSAANDECANATDLGSASTTVNVDNTGACLNEGNVPSCFSDATLEDASVWYSITLNDEADVTIETIDDGSGSFDTQLVLYDGCGGIEIACDDDGGTGLLSLINTGCIPAGTYVIMVDGYAADNGTVDLAVTIDEAACDGGCLDPLACNYDSTAAFDDGSCSFDNDGADCATPIAPGNLGSPNCVAGNLTGSTPSPESVVFASNGQDRWYQFVAQSPGVAIQMNTTDFDAIIELHSTPGIAADTEDAVFVTGGEILNVGNLVEGNTYYIAARAWGSITTGDYELCVETLPDTRCDYGPGPYGVCSTFKADWVGADDYLFNFTSQTSGANYTYQPGFAYTFVALGDVAGLEYGEDYDVAINSIYNRVDGSGSSDVVVVDNNEPCVVNVDNHPAAAVNPAYNCANSGPLFLGQYVPCTPWICGNTDWEWEFTRTDIPELPITHFRGSTNRYLRLIDVAGLVEGATYDVRVRPVFAGASSNYGAVECIQIVGSAGAPVEGTPVVTEIAEERDIEDAVTASVAIYPNPVTTGVFTLNLNNVDADIITMDIIDMTGKTVQSEQITVADGNVNQVVELSDVAMGIYMVNITIDGQIQTERLVVTK